MTEDRFPALARLLAPRISPDLSSPPPTLWSDDAQRRHLRRNFAALAIDGGFYGAAMALISVETLLPTLLHELGGPTWLVALAPSLYQYGFLVIPVLVAGWTERLRRYQPAVAWTSVPQRTVPLLSGLALLFLHDSHPRLTLWSVALTPLLISCFGGLNVSAFWQLFAKTLPPNRRASNMGVRNIIGTVCGFLAASAGATVLARRPSVEGAGLLYVGAFVFMMLSMLLFCQVRELPGPPPPPHDPSHDLLARLRTLPGHWRRDPVLRRYTLGRVFSTGIGVFTPFLPLHALSVLALPSNQIGRFVAAQLFGGILGNLLTAWLGDRRGGRSVALAGGWLSLALCAGVLINRSEIGFLVLFALFGMVTFLNVNGAAALLLESFPAERRPTSFAFSSLLLAPAMLASAFAAWGTGEWHRTTGSLGVGALAGAALTALSLWCYYRLPAERSE